MSMNLIWKKVVDGETIYDEFPIQTPTDLTYSVLECKNKRDAIKLLKEYLEKRVPFTFANSIMEKILYKMSKNWEFDLT